MNTNRTALIIVIIVCLVLVGCKSEVETHTPTTEATRPAITATGIGLPTNTPQPSATPEPTSIPTITPYPTPEIPLDEEGPWLVFLANMEANDPGCPFYWWGCLLYLWAINEDGTGLTKLESGAWWVYETHPTNNSIIAYISSEDEFGDSVSPVLKIIEFPGGEITTVTPLVGEAVMGNMDLSMLNGAINGGGLEWSPDGSHLAFVGALHDETVDVYVYDVASGDVTRISDLSNYKQVYTGEWDRLPDERAHATNLAWSPDGRYVVHEDFMAVGMVGPSFWNSRWAARSDGERALLLMPIAGQVAIDRTYYYGWLSPTQILLSQGSGEGFPIVAIDLDTGEITTIYDGPFGDAAYSEQYNIWLLTSPYDEPAPPIILYPDGSTLKLSGYDFEWVQWSAMEGVFIGFVRKTGAYYSITITGVVSERSDHRESQERTFAGWPGEQEPYLAVSPDNTLWAWFWSPYRDDSFTGLWVGEPDSEPESIYFSEVTETGDSDYPIIASLSWARNSQHLILFTDRGIYIARRPSFELVHVEKGTFFHDSCCWEIWTP